MPTNVCQRHRCVGLLGFIRGHKFKYSDPHRTYVVDNCLRCGMPKGGWSRV